jgi:transposase
MTILSVGRITIYNWFDACEAHNFVGLYDKKRPGRPPKLTEEEQRQAHHYLEQDPRDVKRAVHIIEQETSQCVSTKTIKRFVKKPLCLETDQKSSREKS